MLHRRAELDLDVRRHAPIACERTVGEALRAPTIPRRVRARGDAHRTEADLHADRGPTVDSYGVVDVVADLGETALLPLVDDHVFERIDELEDPRRSGAELVVDFLPQGSLHSFGVRFHEVTVTQRAPVFTVTSDFFIQSLQ